MQPVTFSPQRSAAGSEDKLAILFTNIARYIFIASIALMPLFFIPSDGAPFSYSKIFLVIVGIVVASVFYILAILRTGVLRIQPTVPTLLLWGIVITTSLSAIFSQNVTDGFIGSQFNTQTVLFVGLLALIVTATQFLMNSKSLVMKLYLALSAVSVVLGLHHLLRLIFGPEVLTFGLSNSSVFSLIGGWNDAGIFFGLIVLLSLLVLEQLPLPRFGKALFLTIGLVSTFMLIIIQFTAVWILIGFTALITLMYALTKNRFQESYKDTSTQSMILSGVITVCALVFLIFGNTVGSYVSSLTNIDYVEVRPTAGATLDIAKNTYADNALLGIGPNQFVYAWREHKDPSINNTIFWNTDFNAGSGYLPTIFTTTGILNTVLWLSFLASFLAVGYRMLIQTKNNDSFWYFIASSSFLAAVYLWIIAAIYLPGPAILMLAALCTGISLVSYTNLTTVPVFTFNSLQSKQATILLVAGVIVAVVVLVAGLFSVTNHYAAAYTFNSAGIPLSEGDIERSNEIILQAYALAPHHSYARQLARNYLIQLNQLLVIEEPSEEDRQNFQSIFEQAVIAAQQSITDNPQDSQNWSLLASIYATVVNEDSPAATEQALLALEEAKLRSPQNPEFFTIEAQIQFMSNNTDGVRAAIENALRLKQNYVPAISLFTELEVSEGNIENAIAAARALIQLEPNSSGRYYQLGILQLNNEQQEAAISALERAIEIDNDFANARYVLALQYADIGRVEDALAQLRYVQTLNPDNELIAESIRRLESGEPLEANLQTSDQISNEAVSNSEDGTVQASGSEDTDLLAPVNTAPSTPDPDTANQNPVLENPDSPAATE